VSTNNASLGRTALVTGCNRGIGRAVAEELAAQGTDLIAHARCENDMFLKDMKKLVDIYRVKITPVFFDLCDLESMKSEVRRLLSSGIRIDILINNAGIAHSGLFQMTPVSKVREVFDVNFFAQLELMQLLIRHMIRNRFGIVVNVSSIAGIDLHAGNIAYGVSKSALIAATKTVAAEVGANGVRVNVIAPGMTNTELASKFGQKAAQQAVSESAAKRVATVAEIARVIAFLASEQSSFVNGEVIRVDGGIA